MKTTRAILTLCLISCASWCAFASQASLPRLGILTPSDQVNSDGFGFWVAMSGNTIVAPSVDGLVGAEYVYERPLRGWTSMTQSAKLTASDGTVLSVVSVSGGTIAAVGNDGAVYVFVEPTGGWIDATETARLTASDGTELGSVAVSGTTIVAGGTMATELGAAFVFSEPAGGWADAAETAKLTSSDGSALDCFGCAVAISGNTIAVGAMNVSSGGAGDQGAAYVFLEPAGGWVDGNENAKLTASATNDPSGGGLGRSVAVTGNTVVAGAPFALVNGLYAGSAYVFVEPATGWANMTETAQLSPSNAVGNAQVGWSVGVSGNFIAAGAPGEEGEGTGQKAYEFVKPAAGWTSMTQTYEQILPPKSPYQEFGWSVGISGGTVAIGAPGSGFTDNKGSVYVFGPR